MKKFLLLTFGAFLCAIFFSCHHDDDPNDQGNVRPEDIIDNAHVEVVNKYNITAVCDTGAWTNSYIDSMPQPYNEYYKDVVSNCVFLGLLKDTIVVGGEKNYPTQVELMRYYYLPESESDALDFMKKYKDTAHDAFAGSAYKDITEMETFSVKGRSEEYEGQHYSLKSNSNINTMNREVYLFYYNHRVYGVQYSYVEGYSDEESVEFCEKVLHTITLY